jgi:hypothetical protein
MNKSPFTTRELLELSRNQYAYRNKFGVWGIRTDALMPEQVIAISNGMPLKASDYYQSANDSAIVAEYVAKRVTVSAQIETDYNG